MLCIFLFLILTWLKFYTLTRVDYTLDRTKCFGYLLFAIEYFYLIKRPLQVIQPWIEYVRCSRVFKINFFYIIELFIQWSEVSRNTVGLEYEWRILNNLLVGDTVIIPKAYFDLTKSLLQIIYFIRIESDLKVVLAEWISRSVLGVQIQIANILSGCCPIAHSIASLSRTSDAFSFIKVIFGATWIRKVIAGFILDWICKEFVRSHMRTAWFLFKCVNVGSSKMENSWK